MVFADDGSQTLSIKGSHDILRVIKSIDDLKLVKAFWVFHHFKDGAFNEFNISPKQQSPELPADKHPAG